MLVTIAPRFPWPDDNASPQAYLNYLLPHDTVEWQSIISIAILTSLLAHSVLISQLLPIGTHYTSLVKAAVITPMTVFVAVEVVSIGPYLATPLYARAHHGIGTSGTSGAVITIIWQTGTVLATMALPMLSMSVLALALSNRLHALLPPWLCGWPAVLAILANIAPVASVFAITGHWSPGSAGSFILPVGVAFTWIALAALTLIRGPSPAERRSLPPGVPGL
ncbi:hypothetical protein LKL35_07170 [Streptomyces sp. ET3-23]|uniref:hypothetical protein n=1 Tax=Streptomyces sp. ET3-23 TaxID=2885643 RepID=UPI001D116B6A|nr:hypothetical protein [Streptomyces sp. ET3-23]MCC2275207.1 hypothetical protein [Streptomyces sp. ET3-23]